MAFVANNCDWLKKEYLFFTHHYHLYFFQSHEDATFVAIVQWVNHNPDQREKVFESLFLQIDISSLSPNFLNERVVREVRVNFVDQNNCLY